MPYQLEPEKPFIYKAFSSSVPLVSKSFQSLTSAACDPAYDRLSKECFRGAPVDAFILTRRAVTHIHRQR